MNKLDKQNIPILFPVLVGLLIGVFSGVLITVVLFVMTATEKPMSTYEVFSLFLNLLVIIAAILTIGCTWFSMHMQKRQWLNESFIKHEADVLLEFRKKLGQANGAIHFFLHDLLTVERKFAFIKDKPPVIKYSDLQRNYNQLVDLNNFYNSYQNIFRKHNLEHHIECLSLILEPVRYIPERDLNYDLICESGNSHTYRLEEQVIAKISSFKFFAHQLHDVDNSRPETIDEMDAYNQKDLFKEISRLIGLTSQEFTSLTFKLDELTTYVDSDSLVALNCRQMRFFQKK